VKRRTATKNCDTKHNEKVAVETGHGFRTLVTNPTTTVLSLAQYRASFPSPVSLTSSTPIAWTAATILG